MIYKAIIHDFFIFNLLHKHDDKWSIVWKRIAKSHINKDVQNYALTDSIDLFSHYAISLISRLLKWKGERKKKKYTADDRPRIFANFHVSIREFCDAKNAAASNAKRRELSGQFFNLEQNILSGVPINVLL